MTARQILDLLNDAVRRDPTAMAELLKHSVKVNDALADHPQIVTWTAYKDEPARLGLLGLLNGIVALDGETLKVDMDFDTWSLRGFRMRSEEEQDAVQSDH